MKNRFKRLSLLVKSKENDKIKISRCMHGLFACIFFLKVDKKSKLSKSEGRLFRLSQKEETFTTEIKLSLRSYAEKSAIKKLQ